VKAGPKVNTSKGKGGTRMKEKEKLTASVNYKLYIMGKTGEKGTRGKVLEENNEISKKLRS
jgi:hypothetical protein